MKESEDISARADNKLVEKFNELTELIINSDSVEQSAILIRHFFKACLAAKSQSVEESKWIDDTRVPESNIIKQQAMELDEKDFDQWWWETVYKALPNAIKKNEI